VSALDRLVNACLMPAVGGSRLPAWAERALDDDLAGVCLYGQNLPAPEGDQTAADRIRALSDAVHVVRPEALVALDEEGGDVTRLEYLTGSSYPGNLALGTVDDEALTTAVAAAIGADLRGAGVDVDLAPSVDVNSDPRNPVIGVRSFGADPDLVGRHGVAWVRGIRSAGVAATAKHFPGHGATTADSHLALPVVDADRATVRSRELAPFASVVTAGVDLVMTAHVVFPAFDPEPATLSRRLLVDLLRGELGFDGVVVTDALDMAGVRAAHGIPGAAVRALAAGADLLLLGAEDGDQLCGEVRSAVAAAVRDGSLSEARLVEAAGRVAALRARPRSASAGPSDPDVGLRAARGALRRRGIRPLSGPAVVVELRAEASLAVGNARWSLAEAMEECGLLADRVTVEEDGPPVAAVLELVGGRPLVLAVRDAYRHAWQRAWVAALVAGRPDAVLVALGMPDDAQLTAGPFVAAHGAGRVNTRAAAEALAGADAVVITGAGPTVLAHGRALDADGIVDDAWVQFSGERIVATGTGAPPERGMVVDVEGAWLTPGFVDLHVHGGAGASVDDGPEGVRRTLELHRRHGTTRSLVSLVTAPLEELARSLAGIADLAEADPCLLGAHLEGPFLAASRCGAHAPAHLRPPTPSDLRTLVDAARGTLRVVTLAPELPGALTAVEQLAAAGTTVAVGHTDADAELAARAFDAGARVLTHAFNAMPGLHHRAPGPVGAAIADPRVVLELVLDGHHVHPTVAAMLVAAAPGRVALVSDAMAAAGAPDGTYRLGSLAVDVHDGRAVLAGTRTLAGSTLTQDAALRSAIGAAGIDPVAAVTALTATPARVLGLGDRLGRLAPGRAADVVVLEPDWTVRAVWAAGRPVPR
jgi:beta-N-acetylhexosaminidase